MGNGRDVKLQPHLRWDVGSVVSSLSLQGEVDGDRLGIFASSGESESHHQQLHVKQSEDFHSWTG